MNTQVHRFVVAGFIVATTLLLTTASLAQEDEAPPPPGDSNHDMRARDRGPGGHMGRHRRGRGMRGGRMGGPHREDLTDEEVDNLLEIVRQVRPRMYERLTNASRQQTKQVLAQHWPRLRHLVELKERDPKAFELRVQDIRLDQECRELAQRIRSSSDAKSNSEARSTLRASITEHFEVRQKIREHELAQLQQRIEQLRQKIEKRAHMKDPLIDQRAEELLGSADGARW